MDLLKLRWKATFQGLQNNDYNNFLAISESELGGRSIDQWDLLIAALFNYGKLPDPKKGNDKAYVKGLIEARSSLHYYIDPDSNVDISSCYDPRLARELISAAGNLLKKWNRIESFSSHGPSLILDTQLLSEEVPRPLIFKDFEFKSYQAAYEADPSWVATTPRLYGTFLQEAEKWAQSTCVVKTATGNAWQGLFVKTETTRLFLITPSSAESRIVDATFPLHLVGFPVFDLKDQNTNTYLQAIEFVDAAKTTECLRLAINIEKSIAPLLASLPLNFIDRQRPQEIVIRQCYLNGDGTSPAKRAVPGLPGIPGFDNIGRLVAIGMGTNRVIRVDYLVKLLKKLPGAQISVAASPQVKLPVLSSVAVAGKKK